MSCTPLWTLEEAQEMLEGWKNAYKAVMSAKSYTIDGRTLTRQNIQEIKQEMQYWQDIIAQITGQQCNINRVMRVIPRDL